MQCPNRDGSLHAHSSTNTQGITTTYYQCATCSGLWLGAFEANFTSPDIIHDSTDLEATVQDELICPICQEKLTRSHQESVPPGAIVYACPEGHGYYFPRGEFQKFKKGQNAKLTYFKLWQVPFGSPLSTLLTTLVGLILSLGLLTGLVGGQQVQNLQSKAEENIESVQLFASSSGTTIIAQTRTKATISVVFEQPNTDVVSLETTNGIYHVGRMRSLPPGTYTYHVQIMIDGKLIRSSTKTTTIQ